MNLASEVIGEEEQVSSDAMEIDMKSNNLNFIFKDCFDSSILNHISLTPSPKPSPKHTPSPVHNRFQLSEPVIDSPNPTPIIHILENGTNLVDSEHPTAKDQPEPSPSPKTQRATQTKPQPTPQPSPKPTPQPEPSSVHNQSQVQVTYEPHIETVQVFLDQPPPETNLNQTIQENQPYAHHSSP
ncbi:uncharacterized protein LOC127102002 [Lathyrus oleraceus]|uniref:uncharacterized protein LOC127102002 n=1 Tax=Pisum sativum TaxID=3888 RepID=UPI0021D3A653|nr:uncharacterized protein LOC127102002 [Pisum sativum]